MRFRGKGRGKERKEEEGDIGMGCWGAGNI